MSSTKHPSPPEITGRDHYLMMKALSTTYALIGSLPYKCREESNRHEIGILLKAHLGEGWKFEAHIVRHVLSEDEWLNGRKRLPGDAFPEEDA